MEHTRDNQPGGRGRPRRDQSSEPACDHSARRVAGVDVTACPACGLVSYGASHSPVASSVALAKLFGDFDLVATLPAVRAPGAEVLLYRAPNRSQRRHLAAFTPHVWFEVGDGLWLSHDTDHLLLATAHPVRGLFGAGA